jgi:hypothetical protein
MLHDELADFILMRFGGYTPKKTARRRAARQRSSRQQQISPLDHYLSPPFFAADDTPDGTDCESGETRRTAGFGGDAAPINANAD